MIHKKIFATATLFLLPHGMAFATDAPDSKPDAPAYTPPLGEQPTYGKKYHPTLIQSHRFLDVNPLLLFRRGIELTFEQRFLDGVTGGVGLQYSSGQSEHGAYEGKYADLGLVSQIRFYPMAELEGPFVGARLILGKSWASLQGAATETEKSVVQVAPTAHVGYRFVKLGGITVTGYLGGGLNLSSAQIKGDDTKPEDWKKVRSDINKMATGFRPDMGLTIGVAF